MAMSKGVMAPEARVTKVGVDTEPPLPPDPAMPSVAALAPPVAPGCPTADDGSSVSSGCFKPQAHIKSAAVDAKRVFVMHDIVFLQFASGMRQYTTRSGHDRAAAYPSSWGSRALSRDDEQGYNPAMPRSLLLPWSAVRHVPLLVVMVFAGCTSNDGALRAPATKDAATSVGNGDSAAATRAGEDVGLGTGGAPGTGGSGGSGFDVPGTGGAGGSGFDVPGAGGRDASNAVADLLVHDSVFTGGADAADVSVAQGSGGAPAGGSGGAIPSTGGAIGSGGKPGTGGVLVDGAGLWDAPASTGGVPQNCGTMLLAPSRVPSDVLIVLDRSGSMGYSLSQDCYCQTVDAGTSAGSVCANTTSCTDRWTAIKSAVGQTVASNPDIHWGLKFFSSPLGSSCSVSSTPEVAIGPSAGTAVQAMLDSTAPGNNTPTAAAIGAATAYLGTVADGNSRAILLATDGQPNCAAGQPTTSDVQGTVAAIAAASSAGFPVYVIGVGPSVGNLDNMAVAGGTKNYYPATSPQQLADAFGGIVARTLTCTLAMAQVPPDSSNTYVYVDKTLVPQDATDGWIFGTTTTRIVLTGSYCDKLISGVTTNIQILLGCPGVVPPPILP